MYATMTVVITKFQKQWIYIHVWLVHFAIQQKLTQHCKSTILQFKKNN